MGLLTVIAAVDRAYQGQTSGTNTTSSMAGGCPRRFFDGVRGCVGGFVVFSREGKRFLERGEAFSREEKRFLEMGSVFSR